MKLTNKLYKLSVSLLLASALISNTIQAGSIYHKPINSRTAPAKSIGKLNFTKNIDSHGRKLYKSDQLIIRFKSGVTQSSRNNMIRQYTSHKIFSFGKDNKSHLVKIKPGETVHQAFARFKSDPNIASVNYNGMIYSLATIPPNDLHYTTHQWGLNNTGQVSSGTPGADIKMESAWRIRTDCSSVIVAVLDTGINYNHGDLTANVLTTQGMNFTGTTATSNVLPEAGHESHGTHVAGIIGAIGDNGVGIAGVCWSVRILPVKVLDKDGTGTYADLIRGIDYAVAQGAKVINLSLGSPNAPPTELITAINNASTAGVVVVAAAGNGGVDNDVVGGTRTYPCDMTQSNIICVAAMDVNFNRATFSNYGSSSVDVGAPGTFIYNTMPGIPIFDSAMTGWTLNGGWGRLTTCTDADSVTTDMLLNPSGACTGSYANNANDVAYKSFDLTGILFASVQFTTVFTLSDTDTVEARSAPGGNNPFPGGTILVNNTTLGISSTTEGQLTTTLNSNCFVVDCSIGFQLASDGSGVSSGIRIYRFLIQTIMSAPEAGAYSFFRGTSQAAPHVAGLAALLIAENPLLSPAQTINAIKMGGTPNSNLNGFTTSGNVINAFGSLNHINSPTGVSAIVP